VPWEARGRRTDEYITILRKAWALGPTVHDGEFMAFAPLMVHPKPARQNGIPIVIGGHSEAAARRAGRTGNGFHPQGVRGADLRPLLRIMREAADGAGRDPSDIEVTARWAGDEAEMAALIELGVHAVAISVPAGEPAARLDWIRRGADLIAEHR
jgi:alkanesulfonate monooxygenase SsuD/methylene tetrahydromethanopterin reductase-like flavin-dependent oxidoreductase (luciferase family)